MFYTNVLVFCMDVVQVLHVYKIDHNNTFRKDWTAIGSTGKNFTIIWRTLTKDMKK